MSTTLQPHILVVDDEQIVVNALQTVLLRAGHENVTCLTDSREVKPLLGRQTVDAILLDLDMPHVSGQEILEHCAGACPQVPVIVVTAAADITTAVRCVKTGAFDYLVKPVNPERLVTTLSRALDVADLRRENRVLRRRLVTGTLENPETFAGIVTGNKAMLNLMACVEAVAPSTYPILLLGETGVGKELFARAVHTASHRPGVFVAVNAGGMDDQVFADTLFGHERGAFTGADRPRAGLIESAADGTLFLDEIGDLSLTSQVKLLRLLQDSEYFPVGADRPRRATARFVFATNSDLQRLLAEGRFRKDLYYRVYTHEIKVPPLRDRPEDIALLTETFIAEACQELHYPPMKASPELLQLFTGYSFPGNVRELKGLVVDGLRRCQTMESLVGYVRNRLSHSIQTAVTGSDPVPASPVRVVESEGSIQFPDPLPTLKELNDAIFAEALRRTGGNQSKAAKLLGVSQPTVSNRLRSSRQDT